MRFEGLPRSDGAWALIEAIKEHQLFASLPSFDAKKPRQESASLAAGRRLHIVAATKIADAPAIVVVFHRLHGPGTIARAVWTVRSGSPPTIRTTRPASSTVSSVNTSANSGPTKNINPVMT